MVQDDLFVLNVKYYYNYLLLTFKSIKSVN